MGWNCRVGGLCVIVEFRVCDQIRNCWTGQRPGTGRKSSKAEYRWASQRVNAKGVATLAGEHPHRCSRAGRCGNSDVG